MSYVYITLKNDIERRIITPVNNDEAMRLKANFEAHGASVRLVPVPS